MNPTTVVTGHGRSGTHWLAHILSHFMVAEHEPAKLDGLDVSVDCRQWNRVPELREAGHRVVHLVRDGRDVIRSTDRFYRGSYPFEELCKRWALAVDACMGLETVRFEDLTRPASASDGYQMAHWRDWPPEWHATFWDICGEAMRRHGYLP